MLLLLFLSAATVTGAAICDCSGSMADAGAAHGRHCPLIRASARWMTLRDDDDASERRSEVLHRGEAGHAIQRRGRIVATDLRNESSNDCKAAFARDGGGRVRLGDGGKLVRSRERRRRSMWRQLGWQRGGQWRGYLRVASRS